MKKIRKAAARALLTIAQDPKAKVRDRIGAARSILGLTGGAAGEDEERPPAIGFDLPPEEGNGDE